MNVSGVSARYDNLVVKNDRMVYYVRGVNGEVLAEYNEAANLVAEYVYANGERIAKIGPTGTTYVYLNDHLGSARRMVGNYWSEDYYLYGEIAAQSGSDEDTRYDFTGHERDRGTGLIYAGARFYDPETGRWVSVDPLAEKYPGLSPYCYVANNPITAFDPNGRFIVSLHYQLTLDAMRLLGYGGVQSDLTAHYASVFADNPGEGILFFNNVLAWRTGLPTVSYRRSEIDYSRTEGSQNTFASIMSRWHVMMSDWEAKEGSVSPADVMREGLAQAWEWIFLSASLGNLSTLGANSEGMESLGQGLHALQDAFAHRGQPFRNIPGHVYGDTFPGTESYMQASAATRSALIVHEILSGNFSNVTGGMTLYLPGISDKQKQQIIDALQRRGYSVNVDQEY